MNKRMVAALMIFGTYYVQAVDQSVNLKEAAEVAERLSKARTVKYVITVYCDAENTQNEVWRGVVNRAVETLTLGESDTAQEAEVIDSVIRALEALKAKNTPGVYAGTISVGLGDGVCSADRCGQNCMCTKNGGVCACNAVNGERCCSK